MVRRPSNQSEWSTNIKPKNDPQYNQISPVTPLAIVQTYNHQHILSRKDATPSSSGK